MTLWNEDIRAYLLKKGFTPSDIYADHYALNMVSPRRYSTIEFLCTLSRMEVAAKFPDYAYNDRNPYSTKDCVVRMNWSPKMDKNTIIANIEQFLDKIISMNK